MSWIDGLVARFNAECHAMYGSDWPPERGELIISRLDPPVDEERVMVALRRYLKHYKFMPTLADINTQLVEVAKDEHRRVRDELFRARQKESDATYQAISSGQGLTGRAKYWSQRMSQEVALSNAYRLYLVEAYGLDYAKPAHNRFLMTLINRARDAEGFLLPLEQAKQVAAQMVAEYRAEKAKNAPPMGNLGLAGVGSSPALSNAL
jgi:hypothetical protein